MRGLQVAESNPKVDVPRNTRERNPSHQIRGMRGCSCRLGRYDITGRSFLQFRFLVGPCEFGLNGKEQIRRFRQFQSSPNYQHKCDLNEDIALGSRYRHPLPPQQYLTPTRRARGSRTDKRRGPHTAGAQAPLLRTLSAPVLPTILSVARKASVSARYD